MNRDELAAWWDEAFNETVWSAAWSKAIDGLTAQEAAWKPAAGRHSIWQIVLHMAFWHEYFVHRARGGEPCEIEELDRLNWQDEPSEVTEETWRDLRERFVASHALVREAMADAELRDAPPPKPQLDLRYLLVHDSYHIGQVMYIRALMGKEALES